MKNLPVKIKVPNGVNIPERRAFMINLPTTNEYTAGIIVKSKHSPQNISIIFKRTGVLLK